MVRGATPHGGPQVTQHGHVELEKAGKYVGWRERRKIGRTTWQRIVGYLASWGTGAPPHLTLGSGTARTVHEGGCRFMVAWVKDEEKASEHRQRKREAEEKGKVEGALEVTAASLRRSRAALAGPVQGLPNRRRPCR